MLISFAEAAKAPETAPTAPTKEASAQPPAAEVAETIRFGSIADVRSKCLNPCMECCLLVWIDTWIYSYRLAESCREPTRRHLESQVMVTRQALSRRSQSRLRPGSKPLSQVLHLWRPALAGHRLTAVLRRHQHQSRSRALQLLPLQEYHLFHLWRNMLRFLWLRRDPPPPP